MQIGQFNYVIDTRYKEIIDNYKLILITQSTRYHMVNTKDKIIYIANKEVNDVLAEVHRQYGR